MLKWNNFIIVIGWLIAVYAFEMQWYTVDAERLPSDMRQQFVQFNEDEETKLFLESCSEKSDWLFMQLYHSLMKFFLSWVMNKTSINGYISVV